MGTLNAFYVRAAADTVAITAAIRAKFPKAEVETDTHFYGVTMPDEAFEPPERNLMELAARLKTDVVWLSFQSVGAAELFAEVLGGAQFAEERAEHPAVQAGHGTQVHAQEAVGLRIHGEGGGHVLVHAALGAVGGGSGAVVTPSRAAGRRGWG